MRTWFTAVALSVGVSAIAGCDSGAGPAQDGVSEPPIPQGAIAAMYITVDPVAKTMTLGRPPGQISQGLSKLLVTSDGMPGTNPVDSFEVRTESTATDAGTCGGPNRFCADVTLENFYDTETYNNLHIQIWQTAPATGWEALNSVADYGPLYNTYGLWSYGNLAPGAQNTQQWVFPSNGPGGQFSFYAYLWGDAPGGGGSCVSSTQNWEGGDGGWTHASLIASADGWQLSTQAGGSAPAMFGTTMFGTPNQGDQLGHENSALTSPTFDTTGGATISFDTYISNEDPGYDLESLQVSYDGGMSWSDLIDSNDAGWTNQGNIHSMMATVPSMSGTTTTKFRFVYDTIDGCCGPSDTVGFWVDNFQISCTM